MKEERTGKISKEWVKHVPMVREKLNAIYQVDLPEDPVKDFSQEHVSILKHAKLGKNGNVILPKQKFNIGDQVYILLNQPENALGKKQNFGFRSGDYRFSKKVYEIEDIYNYPGKVLYRYKVKGIDNASYTERQLRLATEV